MKYRYGFLLYFAFGFIGWLGGMNGQCEDKAQSSSESSIQRTGEENFQSLFNGSDLSGWTVQCQSKDRKKNFWHVVEGTIEANSLDDKDHDYVWLVSDREYRNFVLRLRFQAFRDCSGNSGIQFRSRYDLEDSGGWLNGPQMDIHPSGAWRTGMIWDETRGNQRWIYPDIPKGKWVDESMAAPGLTLLYSDEKEGWNDLELRAEGMHIQATLNGVKIMDYQGDGVFNDDTHKSHQVGEIGHIALQIHTGDQLKIRYKDIRILDLDSQ